MPSTWYDVTRKILESSPSGPQSDSVEALARVRMSASKISRGGWQYVLMI